MGKVDVPDWLRVGLSALIEKHNLAATLDQREELIQNFSVLTLDYLETLAKQWA
jgi:hypothetical protein